LHGELLPKRTQQNPLYRQEGNRIGLEGKDLSFTGNKELQVHHYPSIACT